MTNAKQIHLGVHFPGVNNTTVWADPQSGSQIAFDSFKYLAQRAEAAKLDFIFLAEGLRLREHKGQIFDLDVVGRPDTLPILAAVAAVTEHLGLAGTINTTFNEPYELARQFASLDLLSEGRAAWNLVTSSDAFTGENFRRGGYLPHHQRYDRAEATVAAARTLWDSWADNTVAALAAEDKKLADPVAPFAVRNEFFDIEGTFTTPPSPQGHPVLFQAGDSDQGREFAARTADVVFSMHTEFGQAQAFYTDVKDRLHKYGRSRDALKILPATAVVLGGTEQEAKAKADAIKLQQVTGPGAIAFLEQIWGEDLTAFDPEGPLPPYDPQVTADVTRGRVRHIKDPAAVVTKWQDLAQQNNWSIRQLVIAVTGRQQLVGTPEQVADEIERYVSQDATDGFILVPHLTPAGLDDFFDTVIPILQARGSFRSQYTGQTLRDHLGLSVPERGLGATWQGPKPATAWQLWRNERARELDVPYGWLSLTNLIWLDEVPTKVAGLPGTWWATSDAILTEPEPGSDPQVTPVAQGQSLTGAVLEDGSQVEFLARSGRHGLRIRSKTNRPLGPDGLVPAAPYDPNWIKRAAVTWFDQPRPVIVGSAQPGLQHHTAVTGTVKFTHEGTQHQLFITGTQGAASVAFTDVATQTAPWRFLALDGVPTDNGTVLLDFNFAQNYPSAFSRYGTCPAPIDGNALPFSIVAGELQP